MNVNNSKTIVPTAKDFLMKNIAEYVLEEKSEEEMLIEFAKLHVEAALIKASINAKTITTSKQIPFSIYSKTIVSIDKESILNSYPLNKIT
jgi:(p)ppGpp synthase/HD superfamily hydrolase